jgi:hypothetical protein
MYAGMVVLQCAFAYIYVVLQCVFAYICGASMCVCIYMWCFNVALRVSHELCMTHDDDDGGGAGDTYESHSLL